MAAADAIRTLMQDDVQVERLQTVLDEVFGECMRADGTGVEADSVAKAIIEWIENANSE